MQRKVACLVVFLSVAFFSQALAAEGSQAKVTFISGNAIVERSEVTTSQPLKLNDPLKAGDMVTTGKKSRLEITLPDGSLARVDEGSTLTLTAMDFVPEKKRDIKIRVSMGKLWAKAAKLTGISGGFEVSTHTMTAGVRGTVYRVNVNRDDSVLLKVYWGEVLVTGRPPAGAAQTPAGAPVMSEPAKVMGPVPVAGPSKVSMTEWTAIVTNMQQVKISPDGSISAPRSFDPIQDRDEWVRWNQSRDKLR